MSRLPPVLLNPFAVPGVPAEIDGKKLVASQTSCRCRYGGQPLQRRHTGDPHTDTHGASASQYNLHEVAIMPSRPTTIAPTVLQPRTPIGTANGAATGIRERETARGTFAAPNVEKTVPTAYHQHH
nr:hypothetical protein Iba_chr07cCG15210 [Ipomoea batatas]